MPELTDTDWKAQVIAFVGDQDGYLAGAIDTLWDMYADLAATPRLRFWYTVKLAAESLLGHVRQSPDFTTQGDLSVKLNQLFTNLVAMAERADANICRERKGQAVPLVGVLSTTAPTVPPAGAADANAARYSGSPYARESKVQW